MSKHNYGGRPAGSGYLEPNAKPDKRGVWNLYDNTNPSIGVFEVSYWIELDEPNNGINKQEALKELAIFIRNNVKSNIIIVEHAHRIAMGGCGSGEAAGKIFLSEHPSDKKDHTRDYIVDGYEVRLMRNDAVAFLALWQGYEDNEDKS